MGGGGGGGGVGLGEAVGSRRGGGDRVEKVSGDKNKDRRGGNSVDVQWKWMTWQVPMAMKLRSL